MARPPDWYPDTDPKALEVFIDLRRKMTPHPLANEREIFLRVAGHRLDRDTMIRVIGVGPSVSKLMRDVAGALERVLHALDRLGFGTWWVALLRVQSTEFNVPQGTSISWHPCPNSMRHL